MTIEDTWTRIDHWLRMHSPATLEALRSGTDDDALDAFERELGVRLPDDYRASMKIHDGQEPNTFGFIDARQLLSLSEVRAHWRSWQQVMESGVLKEAQPEPGVGVKPYWWSPFWIPITSTGSADNDCLDLDPSPEGTYGQIVTVWHDDSTRIVESSSFGDWLVQFADDLEDELYVYSEEYGGLMPRDQL